jgi:hypothetical protein
MLVAIWLLTLVSLLVWSLVAWGFYRLLTLDPQWVGELEPLIARIPYGEEIERWVPGWQELLRQALELMQSLLGALGGAAPWLVGVAWGVGAALLAGGAVLLSLLVGWWRRRRSAEATR